MGHLQQVAAQAFHHAGKLLLTRTDVGHHLCHLHRVGRRGGSRVQQDIPLDIHLCRYFRCFSFFVISLCRYNDLFLQEGYDVFLGVLQVVDVVDLVPLKPFLAEDVDG